MAAIAREIRYRQGERENRCGSEAAGLPTGKFGREKKVSGISVSGFVTSTCVSNFEDGTMNPGFRM